VTTGARRAPRIDLSGRLARRLPALAACFSAARVVSSLGVLSVLPATFGWRRNQTSITFCREARELGNIFIAGLPRRSCGSPSANNRVVGGMLVPPRPVGYGVAIEWLWTATSCGPGASHLRPYIEHQPGRQVSNYFVPSRKIFGCQVSGAHCLWCGRPGCTCRRDARTTKSPTSGAAESRSVIQKGCQRAPAQAEG